MATRNQPLGGPGRYRLANVPLARGAVFAMAGHSSCNEVNGDAATIQGTVARAMSARGRTWSFPGSAIDTAFLQFPNTVPVAHVWRTAGTWAFLTKITTAATNCSLVAQDSGTSGGMVGWSVGNLQFQVRLFGSTIDTWSGIATVDVPVDRYTTIVAVSDGSLADTGLNIYTDGILRSPIGRGAATANATVDSPKVLGIGDGDEAKTTDHLGEIAIAYIAARMWSDAEVWSFHRNPWQLFWPGPER